MRCHVSFSGQRSIKQLDRDVYIKLHIAMKLLSGAVTGDIGGYLGLLIGGSALTIIELVDLVFYNAFLRFLGKP